jgi:hypothetical protein
MLRALSPLVSPLFLLNFLLALQKFEALSTLFPLHTSFASFYKRGQWKGAYVRQTWQGVAGEAGEGGLTKATGIDGAGETDEIFA